LPSSLPPSSNPSPPSTAPSSSTYGLTPQEIREAETIFGLLL
jgi:hypothetical protein